jgi:hypothetical protein
MIFLKKKIKLRNIILCFEKSYWINIEFQLDPFTYYAWWKKRKKDNTFERGQPPPLDLKGPKAIAHIFCHSRTTIERTMNIFRTVVRLYAGMNGYLKGITWPDLQ